MNSAISAILKVDLRERVGGAWLGGAGARLGVGAVAPVAARA